MLDGPRKEYNNAVNAIEGVAGQVNEMTAASSKTQEIVEALKRIPAEIDDMTSEMQDTFNDVIEKVKGFVDDVTNSLLPSDPNALVKSVSGSIVSGQSSHLGKSRVGRRTGLTDSLDHDTLRAQLHGIFFPTDSPLDDAKLGLDVPKVDKSQLTELLNSAKACVSELATELMNNVPKLNVTATLPQIYLPQFDISFPTGARRFPKPRGTVRISIGTFRSGTSHLLTLTFPRLARAATTAEKGGTGQDYRTTIRALTLV